MPRQALTIGEWSSENLYSPRVDKANEINSKERGIAEKNDEGSLSEKSISAAWGMFLARILVKRGTVEEFRGFPDKYREKEIIASVASLSFEERISSILKLSYISYYYKR